MMSKRKLLELLIDKGLYIQSGDYGIILRVYDETELRSQPYSKIVEVGEDLFKVEYFDRETNRRYGDSITYFSIDAVLEIRF